MTFPPPENVNPFAPPRAGIGEHFSEFGFEDNDAELIRRGHIGHEASIKSIGTLAYLGAFFGAIGTVFLAIAGSGAIPLGQENPNGPSPESLRMIFLGLTVVYLVLTILNGVMGYGLRGLHIWARWFVVVLTGLSLLYTLFTSAMFALTNPAVGLGSLVIGSLIPAYILYLMLSAKGAVVFSPEYKEIIRKTPHVKYRTSLLVKIFLVLLVTAIVGVIVIAVMNAGQPR